MDTPIIGRFVDQGSAPSGSITQYKGCCEFDRISGLDNKSRQVRTDSSVFLKVITHKCFRTINSVTDPKTLQVAMKNQQS